MRKSIIIILLLNLENEEQQKNNFLNSRPCKAIKDLEIGLHNILKDYEYKIIDLLKMKEEELLSTLKTKGKVKTFYNSLKEEIKKRSLNINLKKYSAFKNNQALK